MSRGIRLYYTIITIVIPVLGIVVAMTGDRSTKLKDSCNRYCHNRGCPHETLLPDYITSSDGYFGDIVRGLKDIGDGIEFFLNVNAGGYLIANLLIFCFIIPFMHIILRTINIYLSGEK